MRSRIANFGVFFVVSVCFFGTVKANPVVDANYEADQQGSLIYKIPLFDAPSMSGACSYSIAYSSQGGDKQLGLAWSLSAGSIIHRCAKNMNDDGVRRTVKYDSTDDFCLDGNRLIKKASDISGNVEYYLSNYRHQLVYSKPSAGVGSAPTSFIVKNPNGSTIQLGGTVDSVVYQSGDVGLPRVPVAWLMSYADNGEGGYCKLNYAGGDLENKRLVEVGVGLKDLLSGQEKESNRLTFSYAERSFVPVTFALGSFRSNKYLLSGVGIASSAGVFKNFEVQYEPVRLSSIPRVKSITECSSSISCKPPLEFEWGYVSAPNELIYASMSSFNDSTSGVCADGSTTNGQCNDWNNHKYIKYADINGDGFVDVCFRSDAGIRCAKSNYGEGFNFANQIITDICADGSSKYGGCNGEDNWDSIRFVDVNADRKADLIYRSDVGLRVWLSTGSGFSDFYSYPVCVDGTTGYGGCNGDDNYSTLSYVDINGDYLTDLCYRGDQGIRCALSVEGVWDIGGMIVTDICANASLKYGRCDGEDNFKYIYYADLNSDGYGDVVYRSDSGVRAFYFNGVGFDYQEGWSDLCANGVTAWQCNDANNFDTIKLIDINRDGYLDFCYRSDAGFRCYYNGGGKFDSTQSVISDICADGSVKDGQCNDSDNHSFMYFGDFNGDAYPDLIYRSDQGLVVRFFDGLNFGGAYKINGICGNYSNYGYYGNCDNFYNWLTIGVLDVDGNGSSDVVFRASSGIKAIFSSNSNPARLRGAFNGLNKLKFNFTKMRTGNKYPNDIYSIDSSLNAAYKGQLRLVSTGSDILASIKYEPSLSTNRETAYSYKNYAIDKSMDRPVAGFYSRTIKERYSSAYRMDVTSVYRQDYPFAGLEASTSQSYMFNGNDGGSNKTMFYYDCYDFDQTVGCQLAPGKKYFIFQNKKVETASDLTGKEYTNERYPIEINKILPGKRTETVYDCSSAPVKCFGNITKVTITTLNPDGSDSGYSKVTDSEYLNDETNWRLGKVLRSKVTSVTP